MFRVRLTLHFWASTLIFVLLFLCCSLFCAHAETRMSPKCQSGVFSRTPCGRVLTKMIVWAGRKRKSLQVIKKTQTPKPKQI